MMRAALVNTKMLAKIAEDIHLQGHLLLSKGEGGQTGRAMETILADGFEALIGAIYLDQGYETAERFIKDKVLSRVDEVQRQGYRDPKSVLQERTQDSMKITPTYKVIGASGPSTKRCSRPGSTSEKSLLLPERERQTGSGNGGGAKSA
jgi:ribonuclease-3